MNFTVRYDKDVLDVLYNQVKQAPKAVQLYAEKVVPALVRRELTPIITEPRQPSLPFIWSFDPVKQGRARRWYFANKVRKNGTGRYVRTHGLVNNWKVETSTQRDGSILTISNDTPGLDYVQGPRQVPSHHDSGWKQYDDVLLKTEKKANDLVIDFWLRSVL